MPICENCKKEFIRTKFHPKQKHCGEKCCREAYRKKHREKYRIYLLEYYVRNKEKRKT